MVPVMLSEGWWVNDQSQVSRSPVVLVVDDEPMIRETVGLNLRREGIEVEMAATGREALAMARDRRYDAIVLDIMLPGLDGLEVCRALREHSKVPILLLSARGEEIDRVLGLELGADDYLTKPFAMRELVARVRALLRRARMDQEPAVPVPAPPAVSPRRIVAGSLCIDLDARTAEDGGVPLALTPKEFDLLVYLARHPGTVMTRDALLREVWGYAYRMDTRTVDVHIRWLRQKLERDPASPTRVLTVRGYGYRFLVDDELA